MAGKRRWLAFATTIRGKATINANAAKALLHRQASLLISGVTACEGEFSAGQVIAVLDTEGNIIGKGIAEFGSQQLGVPAEYMNPRYRVTNKAPPVLGIHRTTHVYVPRF